MPKVIGVRQLRDELATAMEELKRVGEIIVTQRGEGKAVLMDLERYNELLERLEFLEDSLDAVEGRREGAVTLRDLE